VGPSSADKPDKVKADKVKADKPDKVKADKPDKVKADKVKADKPDKVKIDKPDKVKTDKPDKVKIDKPDKVKTDKPTAQAPTAQEPTAQQPTVTPKGPESAQPKPAQANAPRAQLNEPAPEARVEVTRTVSPRPKTAASGASAASPEPLATDSASSGGNSADAIPVASEPAAVVPGREPRVANDVTAAAAAVPVDRQQPRLQTIDSLQGYNVPLLLLTLFLAIVFAGSLGYHIRRELRGTPSTAARRRQPPSRALRRRSKFHAFQPKSPMLDWRRVRGYLDIAREHAMTRENALAHGFMDLRSYSRAKGAHLSSRPEAAYDRARRLRTTVGDRLRTLVAGRLR
jgi:hypothetical protein